LQFLVIGAESLLISPQVIECDPFGIVGIRIFGIKTNRLLICVEGFLVLPGSIVHWR